MPDRVALVIPVRSFEHGKSRLADHFTPDQRSRLAQAMAEIVVAPRDDADTIEGTFQRVVGSFGLEGGTFRLERGAGAAPSAGGVANCEAPMASCDANPLD